MCVYRYLYMLVYVCVYRYMYMHIYVYLHVFPISLITCKDIFYNDEVINVIFIYTD